MTFNDNAKIDSSNVRRRRRNVGIGAGAGGGGIAVIIVLFIISQVTGVDVSGLAGGTDGSADQGSSVSDELASCDTGADANASLDCRLGGAADSLDRFWTDEINGNGGSGYVSPQVLLFEQATSTGCGNATSDIGPFYCPPDSTVYIDTSFYAELTNTYGAEGGPLAEMYVLAHEWGHHIQNLTGVIDRAQDGDTGPTSNSVRVELQADCYAGAWAGAASTIPDDSGTPLLKPITSDQIDQALSAAAAVGDDHIQGTTANSDTWTHGSSDSRQKWFKAGFEGGTSSCDTFAVATP